MAVGTLLAFVVYLLAMLGIGLFCFKQTSNHADYILGGRRLGPAVAALSAGASDMSGWLLLGLPGAFYASGMNQSWIVIGLMIGIFLNWQFIAKRLRIYTAVSGDALTLPDFLDNRFRDRSRLLRIISAIVILVFFTLYTSAGLVAGGVLFEQSFGLNYSVALWTGAVIIVGYTFLGGFLAVCWTDFVQGIVMFLAILIVPGLAIQSLGGLGETAAQVGVINAEFNSIFAETSFLGIISLMAWGLGYFGQPHILARFMALRSPKDTPAAQVIGMFWVVLAMYGALFTGYAGVAYFADSPLENPEAVFLQFTQALTNPWIGGVLLAGVLAAIMSTIDSQLLVCSSVISEDFYKGLLRPNASDRELVNLGRMSVIGVALIATLLASNPEAGVLTLVSYAWAGFGAAFGPVVILSLYWRRITRNGAIAGIVAGALTVILWKQFQGGIFDIYEIVPGFLLGLIAVMVVSLMDNTPAIEIRQEFAQVRDQMSSGRDDQSIGAVPPMPE
ncbi:MAG: sodium/proline symporter PutP [Leptolyngbyaceae cyanobacterium MO_188.B28]|nr:sodium/proline symporter PutP [Leptolyngbyaceae cyanobacterium MO_188.B28]